jgi:signal peptide peptidase SppA
MKGQLLISEMLNVPWAIRREVLQSHTRVAANWVKQGRSNPAEQNLGMVAWDDDEPRERISVFEARRREANAAISGSYVAIIPVFGIIVQRAGLMTEWCGGTSTQQISGALNDAINDPNVSEVIFDIDSPGGSVYGVQELADEIYAARDSIKITSIANSLAASAAYWIGAQASEFYVTPGGEVGSIGVWMAHEDWSAAMAEAGIVVTTISAGDYKTEGNPYEALSDDARAFMQSRVDDYYRAFTGAVARGRGASAAKVTAGMGQGRVLGAEAAKQESMVDGIMTMSELISQRQSGAPNKSSSNRSRSRQASRELDLIV